VETGDLVRWREANLTYTVPSTVVERFGGRSVALTVSARNLSLWSKYSGVDPENNVEGGARSNTTQFTQGVDSWGLAVPRRLTLSVRVGF
jgi:TonB-dependent starch-binding outer membrane protein SusC